MPTHSWALAVTELVFYIPSIIPTLYCTWAYRQTALVGWVFILAFVMLQVVGSGMIVGAGEQGHPSTIATILISVGLSPLMVGIAGIIYGWTETIGYFRTKKAQKLATIVVLIYHIGVIAAIGIYATGQSQSAKPATQSSGQGMAKAGILLLLILSLAMASAFIVMVLRAGTRVLRPLLCCIAISLILLKVRLIYQCVAVFLSNEPEFSPVTGSIALRVIFQFLPGAFILLALVTGAVMSAGKQKELYEAVRTDIPLASQSSSKHGV